MAHPAIDGIHHVSLTVADPDLSADWYRLVLGFEEVGRMQHDGLSKVLLGRDGLVIGLIGHGHQAVPGEFSERRTGLDHLGFGVADRVELERWVAVLDDLGVEHSQILRGATGDLVAFRDPDNIALEFYTLT